MSNNSNRSPGDSKPGPVAALIPFRHGSALTSDTVPAGRAGRLDKPAATRRHRLSAGGESRPARAARTSAAPVHQRSAGVPFWCPPSVTMPRPVVATLFLRIVVRPARLERATSWFVVVSRRFYPVRPRATKIRRLSDLRRTSHQPSPFIHLHLTPSSQGVVSQSTSANSSDAPRSQQ